VCFKINLKLSYLLCNLFYRSSSSGILSYYSRKYCQSTQGGDGADRPNKGAKSKLDSVRPGRAFEARKKKKDNKISRFVTQAL